MTKSSTTKKTNRRLSTERPLLVSISASRAMQFLAKEFFAITLLTATLFAPTASANNATDWETNNEARVRLLTPFGIEDDGRTLWIGLQFELEKGWHSYWKNPGAAGLPPSFTEIDSSVIEELEISFPPPHFYPLGGELDANGYADDVTYPVRIKLTEEYASGEEAVLGLELFYLVCKDLCVPHRVDFSAKVDLDAPPRDNAEKSPESFELIKALASLPKDPEMVTGYSASEALESFGSSYRLKFEIKVPQTGENFPEIFFFTEAPLKFAPPKITAGKTAQDLIITAQVDPQVAGQKIDSFTLDYLITGLSLENKEYSVEKIVSLETTAGIAVVARTGEELSFAWVIIFALMGGLILNIMPCVLPVLSIKLMSVLKFSGKSQGNVVGGMLASTAGIVVSFLALALAAVIAKNAGAAVGWGVQFQEPAFVTFLALIVFIFGLNLWGLFEVTLPQSVSTGAAKSAGKGGHFMQGLLATLLATPCSAPFLGTAVSFALTSPAPETFTVFGAVGIGMSTPYLILAAFPGAIRFLPKPGAWMETAKVFFGFLLMGTVIWLMFVLSSQVGSITIALVWLALLTLALILWAKKALAPQRTMFTSVSGIISLAMVLALSYWTVATAIDGRKSSASLGVADNSGIDWKPFTEEALADALNSGAVVFVDVTADWCWTCKINEKLFIETEKIQTRLSENNIVSFKADWTTRNREISDFLRRYGRSGIPFYIIYFGGDPNDFFTFPVTITGDMLAEKLDEAVEKNGVLSADKPIDESFINLQTF
ncbi:MAG: thioredoxin family protein [candidate division Zixibacteria bacterium]|nr:thioredoxin family protein [candidate division Zixibacteria bacterium]